MTSGRIPMWGASAQVPLVTLRIKPFSLSSQRTWVRRGKQASGEQTKVTVIHVITRVLSHFSPPTETL